MKKDDYFRSGLEKALAKNLPKYFKYESTSLPYVMHRKYIPDFVVDDVEGLKNFYIECKGFFRAGDTLKYKSIRDSINGEIIFVLSDPNKKVRKGSKMSMGQWCEKENIKYYTVNQYNDLIKYIEGNGNE